MHAGSLGYEPVVKTSTAHGSEKHGNLQRKFIETNIIFDQ
jgi:hypothetical protein